MEGLVNFNPSSSNSNVLFCLFIHKCNLYCRSFVPPKPRNIATPKSIKIPLRNYFRGLSTTLTVSSRVFKSPLGSLTGHCGDSISSPAAAAASLPSIIALPFSPLPPPPPPHPMKGYFNNLSFPPTPTSLLKHVLCFSVSYLAFMAMQMARDSCRQNATIHGIPAPDVKKLQHGDTRSGLTVHSEKRKTVAQTAQSELLGGGMETNSTIKASGAQLVPTVCVRSTQLASMKGGNRKVAYIDTEGTFQPDRIVPIAERFGMDAGAILDNITAGMPRAKVQQHFRPSFNNGRYCLLHQFV